MCYPHPMNDPLINIVNASAGYNGEIVLKNINLKVFNRDFVGVIGPNGGGKTSLLKLILGLLKTKSGNITYAKDIKIGYLPQQSFIDSKFPISVKEVLLSGLQNKGRFFTSFSKMEINLLEKTLHQLGIENIADKPIGELSGGQRQRAFIGRAIISNPRLLLLDEPNTFVDQRLEKELFEILIELNKTMAILVVSHDVGMISSKVKTIACVNLTLHYHPSSEITNEVLQSYDCPIDLITHGTVPHRVLKNH